MSAIEIPKELAEGLAGEAAALGVSIDELALRILRERVEGRRLSFAAAGSSTSGRGAAESEELLAEGGFGVDSADR